MARLRKIATAITVGGFLQPFLAWSLAEIRYELSGEVALYDRSDKLKKDRSDVVVFIETTGHEKSSPPEENPRIIQRNFEFQPTVLPVIVGTTVDFPNEDITFHNVFSRSKTKPFDLGLYERGTSKSATFDNTGLVRIFCNIHRSMVAYVLVLNNRYFSTTDTEGRYLISDIPAGNYTLVAWQKFGPEQVITLQLDRTPPAGCKRNCHYHTGFSADRNQHLYQTQE